MACDKQQNTSELLKFSRTEGGMLFRALTCRQAKSPKKMTSVEAAGMKKKKKKKR